MLRFAFLSAHLLHVSNTLRARDARAAEAGMMPHVRDVLREHMLSVMSHVRMCLSIMRVSVWATP